MQPCLFSPSCQLDPTRRRPLCLALPLPRRLRLRLLLLSPSRPTINQWHPVSQLGIRHGVQLRRAAQHLARLRNVVCRQRLPIAAVRGGDLRRGAWVPPDEDVGGEVRRRCDGRGSWREYLDVVGLRHERYGAHAPFAVIAYDVDVCGWNTKAKVSATR